MNCRNCNEDLERPCKSSDDCPGCHRMRDNPETVKMDNTTETMLELLVEQLSAATVTAVDIGIWTANRATLTDADKERIRVMRHELTMMRRNVQGIAGIGDD